MYDKIILGSVKIIYAGKQFGNIDTRFSPEQAIAKQNQQIEDIVGKKYFAVMKAAGSDGMVDLSETRLNSGWNVIPADAVISEDDNVCLTLFPADCIPLVIYSVKTKLRALVHIGHNGAELGIQTKVLTYLLKEKNQKLSDLRFYLGPSITKDSYFFPDINQSQKDSVSWQPYLEFKNSNYYIDLQGFVINKLRKAGVTLSQITNSGINSYDEKYFSHRRSVRTGEAEGRNLFAVSTI